MRRIPPVITGLLVVIWLLLNNTLALGHIVLGVIIAVLLMLAAAQLRPVHPRLSNLWSAVVLIFVVLIDIVRSNIGVARIVLGIAGRREINTSFVDIPISLRDPHALAVLAMIVTSTPGTVWVGVSPDGRTLRLHVLDLVDETYWINLIKHRYESRLMRIFE